MYDKLGKSAKKLNFDFDKYIPPELAAPKIEKPPTPPTVAEPVAVKIEPPEAPPTSAKASPPTVGEIPVGMPAPVQLWRIKEVVSKQKVLIVTEVEEPTTKRRKVIENAEALKDTTSRIKIEHADQKTSLVFPILFVTKY